MVNEHVEQRVISELDLGECRACFNSSYHFRISGLCLDFRIYTAQFDHLAIPADLSRSDTTAS